MGSPAFVDHPPTVGGCPNPPGPRSPRATPPARPRRRPHPGSRRRPHQPSPAGGRLPRPHHHGRPGKPAPRGPRHHRPGPAPHPLHRAGRHRLSAGLRLRRPPRLDRPPSRKPPDHRRAPPLPLAPRPHPLRPPGRRLHRLHPTAATAPGVTQALCHQLLYTVVPLAALADWLLLTTPRGFRLPYAWQWPAYPLLFLALTPAFPAASGAPSPTATTAVSIGIAICALPLIAIGIDQVRPAPRLHNNRISPTGIGPLK